MAIVLEEVVSVSVVNEANKLEIRKTRGELRGNGVEHHGKKPCALLSR
jgi:hypothetical protein